MPEISNASRVKRLYALGDSSPELPVRDGRVLVEFANDANFIGKVAIQRKNPLGTDVWMTVTIFGVDAVFENVNVLEAFNEIVNGALWRIMVTEHTSGTGLASIAQ